MRYSTSTVAAAVMIAMLGHAGMANAADKWWPAKIKEGVAAGKAIISTVNPVSKSNVTSKMTVDFDTMGEQTGVYLLSYLKDKAAKVATFPGPAGSGWAEDFLKGFKKALEGKSNI